MNVSFNEFNLKRVDSTQTPTTTCFLELLQCSSGVSPWPLKTFRAQSNCSTDFALPQWDTKPASSLPFCSVYSAFHQPSLQTVCDCGCKLLYYFFSNVTEKLHRLRSLPLDGELYALIFWPVMDVDGKSRTFQERRQKWLRMASTKTLYNVSHVWGLYKQC